MQTAQANRYKPLADGAGHTFFGTATLSFADGFRAEPRDVFEIEAEGFGAPLTNVLRVTEPRDAEARAL